MAVHVCSNCDFKLRTCCLMVNCGGDDDEDEASFEALEDNVVVVTIVGVSGRWWNTDAAVVVADA